MTELPLIPMLLNLTTYTPDHLGDVPNILELFQTCLPVCGQLSAP